MELRQIRSFLSIAETLHFGHTAELIHLSQPALSLQIRALEEEVGVRLFERNRRKTTLTAAGFAVFFCNATPKQTRADPVGLRPSHVQAGNYLPDLSSAVCSAKPTRRKVSIRRVAGYNETAETKELLVAPA